MWKKDNEEVSKPIIHQKQFPLLAINRSILMVAPLDQAFHSNNSNVDKHINTKKALHKNNLHCLVPLTSHIQISWGMEEKTKKNILNMNSS